MRLRRGPLFTPEGAPGAGAWLSRAQAAEALSRKELFVQTSPTCVLSSFQMSFVCAVVHSIHLLPDLLPPMQQRQK